MKKLVLATLLTLLFVLGCKSTNVVGDYSGQMVGSDGKPSGPAVTLKMNEDKTFDMQGSSGTYAVSGDTVTLTITKMMGQDVEALKKQLPAGTPMDTEFALTLSEGGDKLSSSTIPGLPSGASVVFTRSKS